MIAALPSLPVSLQDRGARRRIETLLLLVLHALVQPTEPSFTTSGTPHPLGRGEQG